MQLAIGRCRVALALWTVIPLSSALAIEPFQEYRKHIESAQNLTVLKDTLFGESVNLYNGKTGFDVTDIDLVGNNALPVQLRRRFSVELDLVGSASSFNANLDGVGGWELDVPHISGTFGGRASWADTRCSVTMAPSHNVAFRLTDIWQGNTIHTPGGGDRVMLLAEANTPRPTDGVTRKWSTSQRDAIDCIPMKSGLSGEGYRITTTEGVRYSFDIATSRLAGILEKSLGGTSRARTSREKIYLLASRVEDRNGNWVEYAYDGEGHLTRVWSSDGRQITLAYNGSHLATATAAGRTWHYEYGEVEGAVRLSAVVQPDGSRWAYGYSSALRIAPAVWDGNTRPGCTENPPEERAPFTLTVGHPSGASGQFTLDNVRHYRSGLHAVECAKKRASNGTFYYEMNTPNFFDVMSLQSKVISGPGLATPLAWTYRYGSAGGGLWGNPNFPVPYPCTTCNSEKTVVVTQPDGTATHYRYGSQYALNEGRLLGSSIVDASGVTASTRTTVYMSNAEVASQPFAPRYGHIWNGDDPSTAQVRPVVAEAVDQDGETYQTSMLGFDDLGRPTRINRASTTGSRTDVTEYADERSRWLLGAVSQRINEDTGAVEEQTHYDVLMRPVQVFKFGKLVQSLVWNGDGTASTVADGNGHTTALTDWKRGIPQQIRYPDGTGMSAAVDDNGWVRSVTDESGATTRYDYDAMGRISGIDWPSDDDVAWHRTTQTFEQIGGDEHGISAGHWRQTIATGNARKHVYFDAFWRPLLSEEYDAGQRESTQRFLRSAYDEAGRQVFASYPASSASVSAGTWTTHDALGRIRSVSTDSELGLLTSRTDYLQGGLMRVINPRGQVTTTRFQAFGEPSTQAPVLITQPEAAATEIARDVFGKPFSITRRSHDGSTRLSRSYVYDGHQQLCKSIEPESAATLLGYDGAGNIVWRASGLDLLDPGRCDADAAAVAARRVVRMYDARSRVTRVDFPDGSGSQRWEYFPTGQPKVIHTASADGEVVNTYVYNRRGLLVSERLEESSAGAASIGYTYDAGGFLAGTRYPSGRQLDYAPNALGQPSRAGAYATAVQYYPNGAMQQFTYGNGAVQVMRQNTRQLPERVTASNGAVDTTSTYDANGNVTRIDDHNDATRTRDMGYDGLDRLVRANSPAFGGDGAFRYGYDVLDNLRSAELGGVKDHHYWYDARNRLTNVRDSGGVTLLGLDYDAQGNLARRNGVGFVFDHGNRLLQAEGRERYRYDGHGRRVLSIAAEGAGHIWSFYGNDGVLRHQRDARAGTETEFIHLSGSLISKVSWSVAPAVPELQVPAFSSTGTYDVSWSVVAGSEHYELREQLDGAEFSVVYNGPASGWSASGRQGGSHGYSVRACRQAICGAWSGLRTVLVQLPPTVAPSIILPATSLNGVVNLSWSSVAGADTYCVARQSGEQPWTDLGCRTELALTADSHPAGVYRFAVHAANAAGAGPKSEATTTMVFPPTSAPGLSAPGSSMGGAYTIAWEQADAADVYSLEERINEGAWSAIVSTSAREQAFSGKATGAYHYRVRGGNAAGWGPYSAEAAVWVLQPPETPSLSAPAATTDGTTSVIWTAVAMSTHYPLEQSVDGGEWQIVQDDGSTQSWRSGLGYAHYTYRVRACNDAGCSGYSNAATVVSTPPPATPVINSSLQTRWRINNLSKVRCTVGWTASVGASSYELQVPGSGLIQYRGPLTSVTSPRDTNAYCAPRHVIRACNASGCSAWSDPPREQPIEDLGDLGGGIPTQIGRGR